jgi:tRNA-dihydrouridine synthase 3
MASSENVPFNGHVIHKNSADVGSQVPTIPTKRKLNIDMNSNGTEGGGVKRMRGTAPVKAEYLIFEEPNESMSRPEMKSCNADDAAEAFHHHDRQPQNGASKSKRREKNQGQNKARRFGTSRDEVGLCSTRVRHNEFSPAECSFGERCKFEHDIRKYLEKHKRPDLTTFDGMCPVFEVKGRCSNGWKCRFARSHSKEIVHDDGRKELILVEDEALLKAHTNESQSEEGETGVANVLSNWDRIRLAKKNFPTPKSDKFLQWLQQTIGNPDDQGKRQKEQENGSLRNSSSPDPAGGEHNTTSEAADNRASYISPPSLPSEKRRLYFGPETPILAPLTTQGNLPFRRLCASLGATFTYSEMAMSMPLLQGQKSEWALLKTHLFDMHPPSFTTKSQPNVVYDYNQSHDLRFSTQIAANKPWLACKATEILTTLLPNGFRCIDLNVGCPIDLVYREGAGSALMDSPPKLEKMLRGMNIVSDSTPITVKIRTGTKDKQPTAQKLVDRLVLGAGRDDFRGTPCGVAAITLHGRSRQQRYTRSADWGYINSTAELMANLNAKAASVDSTIHAPDERNLANPHRGSSTNHVFFIGNGDIYSTEHYNSHFEPEHSVSGCMLARGALIKPWLFEEITSNVPYLDKTGTERLSYIEKFCRYGLEAWGSDEVGVGQTRRFLLEWLSFSCRYVPVGLLEVLPPNIQDRAPRFRGRTELEGLLASDDYKDWIKIRQVMFALDWGWR